jgi:hypothetical protein
MDAVKTMTIPEAGAHYFGLGRAASFKAAARGVFPLIGTSPQGLRFRRVSVPAMERMLEQAKASRCITSPTNRRRIASG